MRVAPCHRGPRLSTHGSRPAAVEPRARATCGCLLISKLGCPTQKVQLRRPCGNWLNKAFTAADLGWRASWFRVQCDGVAKLQHNSEFSLRNPKSHTVSPQ